MADETPAAPSDPKKAAPPKENTYYVTRSVSKGFGHTPKMEESVIKAVSGSPRPPGLSSIEKVDDSVEAYDWRPIRPTPDQEEEETF